MNQRMAEHVEAFELQQAATARGRGSRNPGGHGGRQGGAHAPPAGRADTSGRPRQKGEKANKKQMAYVGAVYTIDRFRRTADEVVDELRRRERAAGSTGAATQTGVGRDDACAGRGVCTGRQRLFVEMAIALSSARSQRKRRSFA